MPKTERKSLTFPLAGVAQRAVTRLQSRPYTSVWAANVRSVCTLGKRLRGGSRPGLSKVTATDFGAAITTIIPVSYVDGDSTLRHNILVVAGGNLYVLQGTSASLLSPQLLAETGVVILTDDGQEIIFDSTVTVTGVGVGSTFDAVQRFGKVFMADSVLREYDPVSGLVETVAAAAGTVPAACPVACLYRDRLFLSGVDNVWYASRQGDPYDWAFGEDMGDVGRAVAGQVGDAGTIGEKVTAMIPWQDSAITFATDGEIWNLQGEPTTGGMQQVSDSVGIIASDAWAVNPDGLVCFLSYDGVYVMQAGSRAAPKALSIEKVPEELIDIDLTANYVSMAYDARDKGFYLFVTPHTGVGTHWWIDVENGALWPVYLPAGMQPMAVSRRPGQSSLADVLVGGNDGYLRLFDADATTDDGTVMKSHVAIGPIRMATNDIEDGMLKEIHGTIAELSGEVEWQVIMGATSEEVTDLIDENIRRSMLGGKIEGVCESGAWKAGRNRVKHCRCRGAWCGIWLSSRGRWAFESIAVVTSQLGRLRYGY